MVYPFHCAKGLKLCNSFSMDSIDTLRKHLEDKTSFDTHAIQTICRHFQARSLKREETLFQKGDRFNQLVFVADGIMRTYIHNDDGEEIVKHFLTQGDFFAEIDSFEQGSPAGFNVSAITSCSLAILSQTASDQLEEKVAGWSYLLKQEAMHAMNNMLRAREFLSLGEARDKYRYFVTHYPHLARQVPLKHIAAYLQITQSSLSRIRRQTD